VVTAQPCQNPTPKVNRIVINIAGTDTYKLLSRNTMT